MINLDALLRAHTPSLSNENEGEIYDRIVEDGDAADFALRTCSCGKRVDGFYEYVDHLREIEGIHPRLT